MGLCYNQGIFFVMPPQVTVVIPNYNHARFLARRIESVLAQTFPDYEVLYLDDASTDDSASVFARYADDPRVRAICNTHNTGSPFVQWNRGVREARGEYVWIAEADDDADPRLLETLTALLDRHPNVGMAYCQSSLMDDQDTLLGSCADWGAQIDPQHWTQDFVAHGRDERARFLSQANTMYNASAIVFRRSVYENAGGADETFRMCADWKLWADMMQTADVAFVAAPLNRFRQHATSVSRRAEKEGVWADEAYRVAEHIRRSENVPPESAERGGRMLASRWLSVMLALPPARNRAIWRVARQADPHLLRHLLRQMIAHSARRLRGQRPF